LDTIQKERRELPIYEFRDEIVSMVRENLYCIITGETGSGKSTQIAQYIIDGLKLENFSVLDQ
jgi:HrpA-like RNA helicase